MCLDVLQLAGSTWTGTMTTQVSGTTVGAALTLTFAASEPEGDSGAPSLVATGTAQGNYSYRSESIGATEGYIQTGPSGSFDGGAVTLAASDALCPGATMLWEGGTWGASAQPFGYYINRFTIDSRGNRISTRHEDYGPTPPRPAKPIAMTITSASCDTIRGEVDAAAMTYPWSDTPPRSLDIQRNTFILRREGGCFDGQAPATGSWSPTGNMSMGRLRHTATLLADGRVLVAGGINPGQPGRFLRSVELYDPATGVWTQTGSMTTRRAFHSATLLPNGAVLVAGGVSEDENGALGYATELKSAELYDPESGVWTPTSSMTTWHGGHTATLLPGGLVLVTGGRTEEAELYDPATGTWSPTGSMAEQRDGHTATLLLDGTVLVTGGSYEPTAERYNPATGAWTPAGRISTTAGDHTAALLSDGAVLIVGGGQAGSAERFDPATNTWTAIDSPRAGHSFHTATVLTDGTVLIAGTTAERYDPATGAWMPAGTMALGRWYHTATLLSDGAVLVAGGQAAGNYTNPPTDQAERYIPDPATPPPSTGK